jgi:uncharacterized protein (TIGR03083 family)
MDVPSFVDRLSADGALLASAAARAGWEAAVPGTRWNVRELLTHTGGIHRWAADIVATRSPRTDTPAGAAVGSGPPDDELLDWFREGHAALVETLRAAPVDLDCATFLPADSPLHFWARRQAHETAIHRIDAEGAAGGGVSAVVAEFAQDGIAEILNGFARRRSNAIERNATIGLAVADGSSWLIRLGGARIEAARSDDLTGADVTVRGGSSDLYLWLWNRPSDATADGDLEVADLWAESVRVRWS